jgi:hypothetical protein
VPDVLCCEMDEMRLALWLMPTRGGQGCSGYKLEDQCNITFYTQRYKIKNIFICNMSSQAEFIIAMVIGTIELRGREEKA